MYDAKAEANEFVADDRAEAVSKACRFFGVEESELKIVEADSEVFGLGASSVVVAVPKDAKPIPSSDGPRGGDRPSRGRDRGDRDRGGRDRGGRDRDRGGRGGPDRDRGDRDRSRGQERDEPSDKDREVVTAKAEKPKGESKGVVEGKVGEVGEFILGVVERMALGEFRISESAEGDFCVYELRGEAAISLGTGDGRAVDALQLLGNQFAMRLSDDSPRIVVDAEGDAERRTEFLTRLAKRAAGRATETGRSVALDPMNARDRRILHMAVKEMDAVATMSEGSGRYRQVVVVPEGADEYAEAEKSSNRTSSDD
jgi:predicted RNA-binding protein Jag